MPSAEFADPKSYSASLLNGGPVQFTGEHRVYPRSAYPPEYRASSLCSAEEERPSFKWDDPFSPYPSQADSSFGKHTGNFSFLRLSSTSPQRVERAYARAILASLPQDARDPSWRDGVRGASGSSWDVYRLAESDCEIIRELERCNEVFGYLARLYHSALVPYSNERIEQIVRRGREILAAVRLLPHYRHEYHVPARGTDAPNSSQVSHVEWKPMRESALAEKIVERRRLRAETERAVRRRARERYVNRNSVRSSASSALDTKAREPSTKAPSFCQNSLLIGGDNELDSEEHRRRGAVSRAGMRFLEDDAESTTGSDFKTCIDGGVEDLHIHPSATLKQPISDCRRDSIRWHIPEYDYDARDVPTMRLPEPLFDDSSESSNRPLWLRRKMTKSPGALSTPYFIRPSTSGEISPLTPSPVTTDDTTPASITEAGSTPFTTPLSTTESVVSTVFPDACTLKSSLSLASPLHPATSKSSWHSSRSCRIKAVLGKLSIPKIQRPAWHSSTESEATEPHKFSFGGIKRPRRTRPGIPFRAFSYQTTTSGGTAPDDVDFITVRNDTMTTSEKVRHARAYSFTEEEPQPEYTRTEDEYQELANTVEQLRQELYEERQKIIRMRGRSINRERRPERDTVTDRGSSRRNPFKRWLGGSDV